jgi:hypothetical protein
MEPEHCRILRENRVFLVERLNPALICDYFIQVGLLGSESVEGILRLTRTQREKSRELLNELVRRGPRAFDVFMKALEVHQPELTVYLRGKGQGTREVGTQTE